MVKHVDRDPDEPVEVPEKPSVPLSEYRKQFEPKDPPMLLTEPSPDNPNPGPPRPMSPISARPPEILLEPGQEPTPEPEVLVEPGQEVPTPEPPSSTAPPTTAPTAPTAEAPPPPPAGPPSPPMRPGSGPMAAGPSLQGEDLDGVPAELTGGTNFDSNRPGPFKKGCLTIPAILAGILLIMWLISDKDEKKASDKERSLTTTVIDEDGKPVSDIHNSAIAPDKEQLAPGEELYTGESGDEIGAIAKDGKSRFLSITGGPGVGVGTGTIAAKSTTWPKSGKVTGFGVKLSTSTNKGRYGFNIFIDGTTYSVGCAMEVGETSCFALPENIRRNVPIQKGQSLTIIIGEEGHLEAKGDYKATWWMTFQPS